MLLFVTVTSFLQKCCANANQANMKTARLSMTMRLILGVTHLCARTAVEPSRHVTVGSAHRPNHTEEMITGPETAARG